MTTNDQTVEQALHYAEKNYLPGGAMRTLAAEVRRMRDVIEEIRQAAAGEKQVAINDTEGMDWIVQRIAEMNPKPNPVKNNP